MDKDSSLRMIEQEIGILIRRVKRVIDARARSVHPDLTAISYLLLAALTDTGPRRAREISEMFSLDKGAVSRHLQSLVDLGLVDRRPDPEDGRAALLSATPEAVRRLEQMAAQRRQEVVDRLGDWSDEELTDFARTMARYNAALG